MDRNRGGVTAVGGNTVSVGDEFARLANTTEYGAGDVVAVNANDTDTTALRSLAVGRIAGQTGYLTYLSVVTDQKTCTARFRVHFYNVAAPTTALPGDNLALPLYWANRTEWLGSVDLAAAAQEADSTNGTAAKAAKDDVVLAFQLAAESKLLYYRLQTLDVFTPASGQNFRVEVRAELN